MLFALSILPAVFVHELPGGKAVDKTPTVREFVPKLGRVLRTDGPYRAMLISRLLMVMLAMAGPFYVGFATQRLGLSSAVAVPTLLAMQTIGSLVGALVYTWLGARHNLLYIRVALVGGLLLPISALFAPVAGPLPLYLGFLVSGLALSNLWFAFSNWVVTHATPDQRPIYTGLFNTMMAVVSLIAPFVAGTLAQQLGYEALFVVAIIMGCGSLFVAVRYVPS
jgi:MFS family permease